MNEFELITLIIGICAIVSILIIFVYFTEKGRWKSLHEP